ncbi:unnamed protein product [Ectocarpus sp. 8 AP-2014]
MGWDVKENLFLLCFGRVVCVGNVRRLDWEGGRSRPKCFCDQSANCVPRVFRSVQLEVDRSCVLSCREGQPTTRLVTTSTTTTELCRHSNFLQRGIILSQPFFRLPLVELRFRLLLLERKTGLGGRRVRRSLWPAAAVVF